MTTKVEVDELVVEINKRIEEEAVLVRYANWKAYELWYREHREQKSAGGLQYRNSGKAEREELKKVAVDFWKSQEGKALRKQQQIERLRALREAAQIAEPKKAKVELVKKDKK